MDTAGYSSTEAAVPLTQRLLLSIHHLEDSGKMEAIMGGSLHCYSDDEMFIIRSGLRWVLRTVSARQLAAGCSGGGSVTPWRGHQITPESLCSYTQNRQTSIFLKIWVKALCVYHPWQ